MERYEKFFKIIIVVIIVIVVVLTIAGMVTGPIGLENISVKLSQTACVFALIGIAVSFFFWKNCKRK